MSTPKLPDWMRDQVTCLVIMTILAVFGLVSIYWLKGN